MLGTWVQRFFAIGVVVGLVASPGVAQVFSIDLWPEEGKPSLVATGKPVKVFKEPTTRSSLIGTLTIEKDSVILFGDVRTVTVKVGVVKFAKGDETDATDFGNVASMNRQQYDDKGKPVVVKFTKDETVDYLQYRAEGSFFVRRGGNVLAFSGGPEPSPPPVVEW